MDQEDAEAGFALFARLVEEDADLAARLEASAGEFFPAARAGEAAPDGAARRRHLEWFLFERVREGVRSIADELLPTWRARAEDGLDEGVDSLLESHASVFLVGEVRPGEGAWMRDLAGLGEFPVAAPEAALALQPGDLVVGRLYPLGDGQHHVSPGAGLFRDARLAVALEIDLQRIREERAHPVLRLAQVELEAMFWGPVARAAAGAEAPAPTAGADAAAEARRFLRAGGLDERDVERIFAALATPPAADAGGDVLGAVMDRLAFETELDLEQARRLLLAARASVLAQRSQAPGSDAGASRDEVAAAIAAFDEERAAGGDLQQTFAALVERLGLEGEEDAEEEHVAPDFPGVVGAMVEEFLWDTARAHGEERARCYAGLRNLASYCEPVGVFDNLAGRDLLLFAAAWLPEQRLLGSKREAEDLVEALDAFSVWADEHQGLRLRPQLREPLHGLRRSLPRVVEANRLVEEAAGDTPGELLVVVDPQPDEHALVTLKGRDDEPRRARIDAALVGHLRAADVLRVRMASDGAARVLRVYPPEARILFA